MTDNHDARDGVKERPILFSAPMVRAILDGQKTQTRRVIKPQPAPHESWDWSWPILRPGVTPGTRICWRDDVRSPNLFPYCPYGKPGDRLWVRETWGCPSADRPGVDDGRKPQAGDRTVYAAEPAHAAQWITGHPGCADFCWRPSIHMPRWASRITLEITDVRVERLHEISEADALAEGSQHPSLVPIVGAGWSSRDMYARLWEHINGAGSWAANPWAWVVEFKQIDATALQKEDSSHVG